MKEKLMAVLNKMNEEELKNVVAMMYEEGSADKEVDKEIGELFHEVFNI